MPDAVALKNFSPNPDAGSKIRKTIRLGVAGHEHDGPVGAATSPVYLVQLRTYPWYDALD
jgi:hypothetical protein